MTSASELFHRRRSLFGRSTLLELGEGEGEGEGEIDSSSSHLHHNRISHTSNLRNHRSGNQRQAGPARRNYRMLFDLGGSPPRRSTHLRRRRFLPDRESGLLDQGSSNSASAAVNNSENPSSIQERLRFNGNDRLPGTVLLARERLLRRLNGLSLSENRQRSRVSSSSQHIHTAVEDDFRFDMGDWENEISMALVGTLPSTEVLTLEKRRAPGLSQEAVKRLQVMVFNELENCKEEGMVFRALECSICLESFTRGDKLFCLPCGHRFHMHCLDPWVRTCGDCPYCRMDILLTSGKAI